MITAQEALQRTNNIVEAQRAKALKMVEDEWTQFIEPKIIEAIDKGEYGCKYFWMNSVFNETTVDMETFAKLFENYGTQLGYQVNGKLTVQQCMPIRLDVKISWHGGATVKCVN